MCSVRLSPLYLRTQYTGTNSCMQQIHVEEIPCCVMLVDWHNCIHVYVLPVEKKTLITIQSSGQ